MNPYQKENVINKFNELIQEYIAKVDNLNSQALSEIWSIEKFQTEINLISKDVDQFLDFYQTYEMSRQYMIKLIEHKLK
jgi:hypothetical protein